MPNRLPLVFARSTSQRGTYILSLGDCFGIIAAQALELADERCQFWLLPGICACLILYRKNRVNGLLFNQRVAHHASNGTLAGLEVFGLEVLHQLLLILVRFLHIDIKRFTGSAGE